MQTIILAIAVILLAMLALGLGLLFGRAPIKGSCGGIACGNACHGCTKGDRA